MYAYSVFINGMIVTCVSDAARRARQHMYGTCAKCGKLNWQGRHYLVTKAPVKGDASPGEYEGMIQGFKDTIHATATSVQDFTADGGYDLQWTYRLEGVSGKEETHMSTKWQTFQGLLAELKNEEWRKKERKMVN